MRRIIEKLTAERKSAEERLQKSLSELEEKHKEIEKQLETSKNHLIQLENQFEKFKQIHSPLKRFFYRKFKKDHLLFLDILKEYRNQIEQIFKQINENLLSTLKLFSSVLKIVDAKDREWDALSNNHVNIIFKSMEWRIDKLINEYQDVKLLMKKFLLMEDKLDSLLSSIQKKKLSPEQIEEIIEPLRDYKYAGFENRFRGYEENLLRAQKKYLPYFLNKKNVVDLGCGRGEFLQILKENNIDSYGVDSNEEMVEICHQKGLKCIKADILQHLASLEDESLEGIFSAQVIEHLPPKYLIELIRKSYFKLKKNCYLILETINPASLFSLVNTFFLDLSHQKPIHPKTLKFLFEISGFEEVEIKYFSTLDEEKLQEIPVKDDNSAIINENFDRLNKLLFAPSDYAVIGKKI
ncbi:methyltransferase domain-containing protein [Candidatus Aminicenantes bacterium AC-708-M15]|jgi:O-antigen chain-terminating methyltransferase|nr:methyltransferase domain-containing protein [SCandidatus Aminicenantes bacterium Aminicenantia_JdfR_composite]MCP2598450.1 methyltransferase domain-containing protein [Candidatus Aminicenantes bacterium AC-335-L06]MCP2604162.1 methyltransferase domain-containing protein [Candidatus Aminicenantes bacterium AC-708-M15]MCP2618571.1 methyltransferase domain-containing protein [Candidatus Aminicenantes bacterium AC-335-A11]